MARTTSPGNPDEDLSAIGQDPSLHSAEGITDLLLTETRGLPGIEERPQPAKTADLFEEPLQQLPLPLPMPRQLRQYPCRLHNRQHRFSRPWKSLLSTHRELLCSRMNVLK